MFLAPPPWCLRVRCTAWGSWLSGGRRGPAPGSIWGIFSARCRSGSAIPFSPCVCFGPLVRRCECRERRGFHVAEAMNGVTSFQLVTSACARHIGEERTWMMDL